ncbi:MAG TPA: GAF domain-containing protein, partial [Allocoleopsis sp.]
MNSLPNIDKQLVDLEQVLQILREEQNPEIFIEATINYLRSHFDYRLIWIGLYEKLQHYILGKGGFSAQGESSLFKQRFNLHSGDLLEQVLIQQQQIPIADLRQENRAGEWRQAAQKLGIQGAIFVPIRYKDRCFGVALLGSHLWGISPRSGDKAHLSSLLGALAMSLYHNEKEVQVNHSKKIDKVFFKLLDELVHLTSLEQKLNKIVSVTNELISNIRTNIYWYNSEQRYFWVKGNNPPANVKKTAPTPSLNVEEVSEFYQYLISGQLVAIGAGKSPLKTETTGRLLTRLRVRSILAMPIFIQQKLVGFLAV